MVSGCYRHIDFVATAVITASVAVVGGGTGVVVLLAMVVVP